MDMKQSPWTLAPSGQWHGIPLGEEEVVLGEEGQEEVYHPFCCHGNQVLPNQVPLERI